MIEKQLPVEVETAFYELTKQHGHNPKTKLACLYAAYRISHQPRTLDEVATEDYSAVDIGKAFRKLNLKIPLPKPEEFVDRYCEELGLPVTVSGASKSLISQARHCNDFCCVCNKTPHLVAAASVYISGILSGHRRTQREFEEQFGITATAIRKHYVDIAKKVDIDIGDFLS